MNSILALQLPGRREMNGICTCEACGERFLSLTAFDLHRTGKFSGMSGRKHTRRCLSVAEMIRRGMRQRAEGSWTTGRVGEWSKAA